MSLEDHFSHIQLLDSDNNVSITSGKSDGETNIGSSENGIKPYSFEPRLSDFESESSEEDNNNLSSDASNIPHDLQRLQNTQW